MLLALLAWSGALLSCLLSLPQLVSVLRSTRADGVSAGTYALVLANAAVWAAWAVLSGEYAAGVPALVNGPAAVLIILRVKRTAGARPSASPHTASDARPRALLRTSS